MKQLLIFAFAVFTFFVQAAESVETIPNPKTENTRTYVSNPDGILNTSTIAEINILLDSLETKTGAEVAVVAVNSIGDAQP